MKDWWSPLEIAEARLPGLPETPRGVTRLAERCGWRSAGLDRARRRRGKGGGWEYHRALFPAPAQARLAAEAAAPKPAAPPPDREAAWAAWETLPESVRAVARARLEALDRVDLLVTGGLSRTAAVAAVARDTGNSIKTLWNWLSLVADARRDDRLAHLAPKHRLAERRSTRVAFDPEAFDALYADFMRKSQPNWSDAWRRTAQLAAENRWALPAERTARRHFEKRVPTAVEVLAREGADGLKKLYPPQVRDKTALHAMECVNADGHKWDVFVRWPDGEIGRPVMTAFQDVYSGMILSWRVDRSENKQSVLLAFGDMVEQYGIPDHCVLDNGRNFASKWLTGGTPNRFRFKVRDDEPVGVMTDLGIEIHWATPYSGQSKPIERAFRDLAQSIARHPAFEGAWTGNRPDAKPSNHGSRAVPVEEFLDVIGRGIAEHNLRSGRRSEVAAGRSLAATFAASYETAPIRQSSREQRRMWLLAAEGVRGHRDSGTIRLLDNEYWAEWSPQKAAGEKVIVRFDPADLHAGVHLYTLENVYLGHAPCTHKGQFLSAEDARLHNRARRDWMRAQKDMDRAMRRMSAAELAAQLRAIDGPEEPEPEARVVRPVFARGGAAAAAFVTAEPAEAPGEIARDEAYRRGVALVFSRDD